MDDAELFINTFRYTVPPSPLLYVMHSVLLLLLFMLLLCFVFLFVECKKNKNY